MHTSFRVFRNKKGFTLVELIIAIGIISLLSTFILHLFIISKNFNEKAYDLDQSVLFSTNVIELFKAAPSPEAFTKDELFKNADLSNRKGSMQITMNFDKKWNLIPPSNSQPSAYVLNATVLPRADVQPDSPNAIYDIKIRVSKTRAYLMEKTVGKELFSIESAKYFNKLQVIKNEH